MSVRIKDNDIPFIFILLVAIKIKSCYKTLLFID